MDKALKKREKIAFDDFVVLFYFAASYCLTRLYFLLAREYAAARLEDLTVGKAHLPFQFRVLVPYMVRFIATLTKAEFIPIYAVCSFIFIFTLFLAYRAFLRLFFEKQLADLFSFSLVYVIPFNYGILTTMFYPSDIPAILFFTLSLIAMYKKDWQAYYLLYALGTLNRETTCFLTFIFFAVFLKRMRFAEYFAHLIGQTLIWFGIKQVLYIMFKGNPGELYEYHIKTNIEMFLGIFSLRLYPLLNLGLNFGGLWVLAIFGYKSAHKFLRRSTFVFIPFLVGMFIVGNLYEMRIYGELIPIVVTLALYPVAEFIKGVSGFSPENLEKQR